MRRALLSVAVLFVLSGCDVVEVFDVVSDSPIVDVGADPSPAPASMVFCEGAFVRDADGVIVVEGADGRPVPCPTPSSPPVACEGAVLRDADGVIVGEGSDSRNVPCAAP